MKSRAGDPGEVAMRGRSPVERTDMKLCKDCKYVKGGGNHSSAECRSPNNTEISPVTGEVIFTWRYAAACRVSVCGPDANWFEPKEGVAG